MCDTIIALPRARGHRVLGNLTPTSRTAGVPAERHQQLCERGTISRASVKDIAPRSSSQFPS
eukprot:5510131-Pyramimonas_sp.AAC.2